MERIAYYCDEAGNTGANYLDRDQRYYVHAGFLVRQGHDAAARNVITRALGGTKAAELSAGLFLRRGTSGLATMTKIISALGDAGVVPTLSVFEKRYALGARVVEALLDPFYNARATGEFTDPVRMHHVSTVISELPLDVLAEANAMMKDPSDPVVRTCCRRVANALERAGQPTLAGVLRGALDSDDLGQADTELARAGLALNIAGFVRVMTLVHLLAERRDVAVEVVHDEQRQFETAFRGTLAFCQSPRFPVGQLALGREQTVPTLTRIRNLRFAKSEDEPLVQAADLLAGSMAHLLRRLDEPEPWTLEEAALAAITLAVVIADEDREFHHYYGSDALGARIMIGLVNRESVYKRKHDGQVVLKFESGRAVKRKTGRNDPCSCRSGKKHKHCCRGRSATE